MRNHFVVLEYTDEKKQRMLDAGHIGLDDVPAERLARDGLDRLVAEAYETAAGDTPAPDVVAELADRIRDLNGPTNTAQLFNGLPGGGPRRKR